MAKRDPEEPVDQAEDSSRLTLHLTASISSRLEEHLNLLRKMLREHKTKKDWITEAVEEKLRESKRDLAHRSTGKRFNLPLKPDVAEKLEHNLELLKRMGIKHSKTRWVLDAISEKLDRESIEVWEWLASLRISHPPSSAKDQ